jgi:hypothetical protein
MGQDLSKIDKHALLEKARESRNHLERNHDELAQLGTEIFPTLNR